VVIAFPTCSIVLGACGDSATVTQEFTGRVARVSEMRDSSDITTASIEGAFDVGNTFSWSSYGLEVTSTIYAIDQHSRILWGGTGAGITGIHEWTFEETLDGVRVRTNESFAGEPVEADATNMQSLLDASLISWLDHMKKAAESGA
jgi:hypothetical protein